MDVPDDDVRRNSRRLTFSTANFDDYAVALMAKLRVNLTADRILSGELQHPLVQYQRDNLANLQALNVPFYTSAQLLADPVQCFVTFLRAVTAAILHDPAPVPVIGDLNALQEAQNTFRQAESFIYSTIVSTLQVGKSMHYARSCPFGAGQLLLRAWGSSSN